MDARLESACWSPTRRCATRTSRCSRRACARTTWPRRALLRAPAARAVLARVLGRRDLRRRDALPQGGPVGAARATARGGAEHAVPDAAARGERGRLHELCRQRRALLRPAGGRRRHRRVPRLRLAELGRQHARRDRRGAARPARCARPRSATPATCSIRAEPSTTSSTTCGWPSELEKAGAHMLGIKDMAGLCRPRAAARAGQGAEGGDRACRSTSTPTTPAASARRACSRRSRPGATRSTPRSTR